MTILTQQFKEIATGSGTTEEKQKQQETLKAQIAMLQAQLQQLLKRQAEETQQKQEQQQSKVEGVNKPSDEHQIDIYV
jgi:type II secretory pathway component PulJ